MSFISNGTPGRKTKAVGSWQLAVGSSLFAFFSSSLVFRPSSFVLRSNHIPLAVPILLGRDIQLSGSSACFRFTSVTSIPLLAKKASMFSYASSLKTNLVSKNSQMVSFVMSSLVGPRPPLIRTTSARFNASSRACRICSRLSEITVN